MKVTKNGFSTVVLGVSLVVVAVIISLILFLTSEDNETHQNTTTPEETIEQESTQLKPEEQPDQSDSEEQLNPAQTTNQPQLPTNWDQLSSAEKTKLNPFGCLTNKVNDRIFVDSQTGKCNDRRSSFKPAVKTIQLQLNQDFVVNLVNYDVKYYSHEATDPKNLVNGQLSDDHIKEIRALDFIQFGYKITQAECKTINQLLQQANDSSLKEVKLLQQTGSLVKDWYKRDDSTFEVSAAIKTKINQAQSAQELAAAILPIAGDIYNYLFVSRTGFSDIFIPIEDIEGTTLVTNYDDGSGIQDLWDETTLHADSQWIIAYKPMIRLVFNIDQYFKSQKINTNKILDQAINNYQVCQYTIDYENQTNRPTYAENSWCRHSSFLGQVVRLVDSNGVIDNQSVQTCRSFDQEILGPIFDEAPVGIHTANLNFFTPVTNNTPRLEINLALLSNLNKDDNLQAYLTDKNTTNFFINP